MQLPDHANKHSQTQHTPPSPAPKKSDKRTAIALWLLIGPTVLIILSIIIYAIVNWSLGAIASTETTCIPTVGSNMDSSIINGVDAATGDCTSDELFEDSSNTGIAITNIILFLMGMVGVLTWLPGIIIGIVLLVTRPQQTA